MNSKIIFGYITLVVSFCLTAFFLLKTKNTERSKTLFPATMSLLFLTLTIMSFSWILLVKKDEDKDDNEEKTSLASFMDFKNLTIITITIGMIQGFVFGTIDNFGMALGLDGLKHTLEGFKFSDSMIAGVSNLYSSIFGSAMGAVLEKAIKSYSGVENTPWWGNLFGIIFGSLFGLKISKFVESK
mgnify:CR=1 FL=1